LENRAAADEPLELKGSIMIQLETIRAFFRYDDWANDRVLLAAGPLTDEQLDRSFEMGRGSLRKTLVHILCAEQVWVQRWQGHAETPWPDEGERAGVAAIVERLREAQRVREVFLSDVRDDALDREIEYRDSFGGLFSAALGDMMLQLCNHSTHHRAQAVNMIRRIGGSPPELDYMYWRLRRTHGD